MRDPDGPDASDPNPPRIDRSSGRRRPALRRPARSPPDAACLEARARQPRHPRGAHSDKLRPLMEEIHATTVICVRRDGKVAVAGDGQVTVGNTVMKHGAAKVRRLYHDKILAGFAGSAADAFALFARFEAKLEEYRGNMERSVVELAKDWRMDKYLRQLQAFLIVANAERAYLISGTGDLIQPDDGILAIGSGGPYALAAARALMKHTELNAAGIAEEALRIAATICIYTNDQITVESL